AVLLADEGGPDTEGGLGGGAAAVVDGEQDVVGALEALVPLGLVGRLEGGDHDHDLVELGRDLVQLQGDGLVVALTLARRVVAGVLDGAAAGAAVQGVHEVAVEARTERDGLVVLEEDGDGVEVGPGLAGQLAEEAAAPPAGGIPGGPDGDGAAHVQRLALTEDRQARWGEPGVRHGGLSILEHVGHRAPRPAFQSLMDLPLLLSALFPRFPAGMPAVPSSWAALFSEFTFSSFPSSADGVS